VRGALSVRETERLVRGHKKRNEKEKEGKQKPASVRDLEQRLTRHLGAKVELETDGAKGRIVIPYASLDELDRLLDLILR